jgi:hypothetical protein
MPNLISVSSKTITRLEQNFRETYRRFGKFLKSKDFNQLGLRKYLEGPSKRQAYRFIVKIKFSTRMLAM